MHQEVVQDANVSKCPGQIIATSRDRFPKKVIFWKGNLGC